MREKLSDNSTYPILYERTFQPITSNHHNADHVADFYFLVLSSSMCAVFCSYSSLQKETALISRQRCRLQRLTALLFTLWTHKNEEQNTVWSKICVSFLAKDVIKRGAFKKNPAQMPYLMHFQSFRNMQFLTKWSRFSSVYLRIENFEWTWIFSLEHF